MLLILRSRAASSLLTGLFGSLRFFSGGTWSARGWRWPIGASRIICDWFVAPPGAPVCASAIGPPIRAANAVIAIDLVVNVFRILPLPLSENAPIARDREHRSLHNCGAPGPRSPEPFGYRPTSRATRCPPPPARQGNQASPHSRRCGCLDLSAAPVSRFLRSSSVDHGFGG